jgi:phage terminase large subunit GpA-like protein
MVANGKWQPTNPASQIAGFHLSEFYSPWRAWSALADDWLKAQGSIERQRAFLNTSLSELWDDTVAGAVTEAELLARCEVIDRLSRSIYYSLNLLPGRRPTTAHRGLQFLGEILSRLGPQ